MTSPPEHDPRRRTAPSDGECRSSTVPFWLCHPAVWTPTVDVYRDSRAQYLSADIEECRNLAYQVSGYAPQQAVVGSLAGGLVGAATGAALGAALGNPAKGAAVGAAAVGIGAGAKSALGSESAFKRAYINCMRGRGHPVID